MKYRSLGRRSFGQFDGFWKRGKARMANERTNGVQSYWTHVADAASIQAFRRDETDPLLSAESLPENSSLIDFKAFAKEKPERLFQLLSNLRPEFQELFAEYYILEKSQSFLAKVHGQIQTRIWQNLRIIEQAIGSLIVLGEDPSENCFRPIFEKEGLEKTHFGSLASMVALYSHTQDYPLVAKTVSAPVPAIRKIFRPAIEKLLASRNLKSAALGAFLKNLTHQASLTGSGLSKRCYARIHRMKTVHFDAPSPNTSPLISYGAVSALHDTPWFMFEISSDHRMEKILPLIHKYGKRIFGPRAAQIFAPVDEDGELELGYILARSVNASAVRSLLRIRGISEMAGKYDGFGELTASVLVPDADIQKMIKSHAVEASPLAKTGDFVEVLSGDVARYCGTAIKVTRNSVTVKVEFPSGRGFLVDAVPDAVKVLKGPAAKQTFWGFKP